ncbi:MAG: hypothetical protein LC798_07270 [Chloroflexi bacterium]|nr:hypothetical protein [Chloroflexota bacterium]
MNERDQGTESTEQSPHERDVAEYEETDDGGVPSSDATVDEGGRPTADEDLAADMTDGDPDDDDGAA